MSGKSDKQGGESKKPGATPQAGHGRGRGIPPTIGMADEILQRQLRQRVQTQGGSSGSEFQGPSGTQGQASRTGIPVLEVVESSSSGSSSPSSGEKTIRGRGGFKAVELHTIPEGVTAVKAGKEARGQQVVCLSNFIKIEPIKNTIIYQYRVDMTPNIERISVRIRLFNAAAAALFSTKCIFDGVNDARSKCKLADKITTIEAEDPSDPTQKCTITIKNVGTITGSFEMTRVYNMQMKQFLRSLGFYQMNATGAYVHPLLSTPIGQTDLVALRGYKTSANIHENNVTLMTLESCHKILQTKNVLQYMNMIRNRGGNFAENIKNALVNKLVVTSYNKIVYKIEDVNFRMKPMNTFLQHKTNTETTYQDYYQNRYQVRINDQNQPLLLAVQNNKRRRDTDAEGQTQTDCYLIPELCNIAGLTDEQRADNRLKNDLVRASQIDPKERVRQLRQFLEKLNSNSEIKKLLDDWGYSYGNEPLTIQARMVPTEKIGVGRQANAPVLQWPTVDGKNAGFDNLIMREQCAVVPPCPYLKIILGRQDFQKQQQVLDNIKRGFQKVGLNPNNVEVIRIEGNDNSQGFSAAIRRLQPETSIALIIVPGQNKDKYDTIKKVASTELGLTTQVVTSRLLTDDRKASGAAVKIGVQVVAKLGGEPWWINLPLGGSMVCGYDTYHDSAQRGRSFGAFIASMNRRYSRWWSKADLHDRMDELSAHLQENLLLAMQHYREKNENKYPDRIFIYRDGVGDGQLEHVVNIELKQIRAALERVSDRTQLCYIIVNKRIGARFYWRNGQDIWNPCPGTIIDDIVTRKERYDFYLISQSTRQGTVAPTYYNIIHDDTGLEPEKHQQMAYKMCFAYYNWTGTVRVPAPCQYAHKLALLCGEHLHNVPNVKLDDRLHFL